MLAARAPQAKSTTRISLMSFTVNSEIFARVLFSHMRSFEKIKSSRNAEITVLFTNIRKSWHSGEFFGVTNMSFNAIPDLQYLGH